MPCDRIAPDEGGNNPQAYNTYGASARIGFDFRPVMPSSITAYETTSGFSRGDTDGGAAALFPVNGVPNGFGQIDGEPLPNAPEYTLDLTARWDQPLNDGSRVFIATDWNLQDYTQFTLYRAREFTANGNFEGGLRIGYLPPADAWELSVFARNITNEKNLKGVIEHYMATVFNDPRIVGVSLSGKFR